MVRYAMLWCRIVWYSMAVMIWCSVVWSSVVHGILLFSVLAQASCDFENGWCGWKGNNPDHSEFGWTREYMDRNKSIDEQLSCKYNVFIRF